VETTTAAATAVETTTAAATAVETTTAAATAAAMMIVRTKTVQRSR
jgi:hypothetical protein